MSNLWIRESWVEVIPDKICDGTTDDTRIGRGDSDIYETFTDDIGKLYKHLTKEHGRCISKVYNDAVVDGKQTMVQRGWVFLKRRKYSDCDKTYLCETWVAVFTAPPKVTREYFPYNFDLKRRKSA